MKKKRKAHQYCKKAQKLEPKDPEAYLIEAACTSKKVTTKRE